MSDNSYIVYKGDKTILKEIGSYIKQRRIAQGITQDDLAKQAAVSRSTLSLIERGENISLSNLIKILRMLDALYVFNEFKTPDQFSPLQLAKIVREPRQRVYSRKKESDENDLGW